MNELVKKLLKKVDGVDFYINNEKVDIGVVFEKEQHDGTTTIVIKNNETNNGKPVIGSGIRRRGIITNEHEEI